MRVLIATVILALGLAGCEDKSRTPFVNADGSVADSTRQATIGTQQTPASDPHGSDAPMVSAAEAATSAPAASNRGCRFTQAEFRQFVNDKTKGDILDAFGKPDFVHENDEWHYVDGIHVCDAVSGTSLFVSIRFQGLEGRADPVIGVSF